MKIEIETGTPKIETGTLKIETGTPKIVIEPFIEIEPFKIENDIEC